MEHSLVHDLDQFISPVSSSNTPPTVHTTNTASVTLHDDNNAPEMRISLTQLHKHCLTNEEFDYVINSLLEYLEEAELASPESGCEEYEYYSPENTKLRLQHEPWYAPFLWWIYWVFTPTPLGRQGHPCTSRTTEVRTEATIVKLRLRKWTRRMTGHHSSWSALRAALPFMRGW
jgi:hypothetical protein